MMMIVERLMNGESMMVNEKIKKIERKKKKIK
jgi:hypothetical protein